jgi:acetylcholinesterase
MSGRLNSIPSCKHGALSIIHHWNRLGAVMSAVGSLKIDTSSGSVQGFLDFITPNLAQHLGTLFADQPVRARPWLPPSPELKANETLDATDFGSAYPQFEGDAPNVWLTDTPEFIISPRDYQGEECLSLHV